MNQVYFVFETNNQQLAVLRFRLLTYLNNRTIVLGVIPCMRLAAAILR